MIEKYININFRENKIDLNILGEIHTCHVAEATYSYCHNDRDKYKIFIFIFIKSGSELDPLEIIGEISGHFGRNIIFNKKSRTILTTWTLNEMMFDQTIICEYGQRLYKDMMAKKSIHKVEMHMRFKNVSVKYLINLDGFMLTEDLKDCFFW